MCQHTPQKEHSCSWRRKSWQSSRTNLKHQNSPMLLFLAFTSKKSLEGWRYYSRQAALGQQCFSFLRVYLRKTTRKLSLNDLNDLNFVFVQRVSILKGCTRVLRQMTIPLCFITHVAINNEHPSYARRDHFDHIFLYKNILASIS